MPPLFVRKGDGVKMSKVEEFRANADECLRSAKQVQDPALQTHYRDMAVQWLVLAEMEQGPK